MEAVEVRVGGRVEVMRVKDSLETDRSEHESQDVQRGMEDLHVGLVVVPEDSVHQDR